MGSVTSRASAIVTFSPQTHHACGPGSCASDGGELRSTMPDKHIRGQVSAHAGQQARTTGTRVSAAPAQRRAANRLTAGFGSQEQCRPAGSAFTRPFGNEFGASRRGRPGPRREAPFVAPWNRGHKLPIPVATSVALHGLRAAMTAAARIGGAVPRRLFHKLGRSGRRGVAQLKSEPWRAPLTRAVLDRRDRPRVRNGR